MSRPCVCQLVVEFCCPLVAKKMINAAFKCRIMVIVCEFFLFWRINGPKFLTQIPKTVKVEPDVYKLNS